MRYDEFRDRWQAALRTVRLVAHHDRPEETIDLNTTARRWRVRPLSRSTEPFNTGATISFWWDPFASARSYTREEDLLTELFGRGVKRSTQPRWLRVDITLHAALPFGKTIPMPAPDIWGPWVESAEGAVDDALLGKRRLKGVESVWRGDVEVEARTTPSGAFALHGMSLPAYEIVVIPRIWDDPRRQAREPHAERKIDALAARFRAALDAWTESVGALVSWIRHAPSSPRAPSRRHRGEASPSDHGGPERTH